METSLLQKGGRNLIRGISNAKTTAYALSARPSISPPHHKISLNIRYLATIYVRVRRFKNIVFTLAALIWLPVSAHCQLESVPGLEFLRCSVETADTHTPAKDCTGCCAVEKSQYRTEHVRLTVPTPDLLPLSFTPTLPALASLPAESSVGILTAAPPELPPSRHFLFRTALSPRAPSLAS